MGIAFGKISVEVPQHVVLHTTENYQIWRYPPAIAASVHAKDVQLPDHPSEKDFTSTAFRTLARYIGVFGSPQNRAAENSQDPEKIAMTAPVEVKPAEKIAMTAPVEVKPAEQIAMTAPVEVKTGENIAMTAPVEVKPGENIAMTAPVEVKTSATENNTTDVKNMQMSFFLPSKYTSISQAPTPTNEAVKLVQIPSRYHAVVQYSGNLAMPSSKEKADVLIEQLRTDGVEIVGEWSYCGYNPPFTLPWMKRNEVHVPVAGSRFDPAPTAE